MKKVKAGVFLTFFILMWFIYKFNERPLIGVLWSILGFIYLTGLWKIIKDRKWPPRNFILVFSCFFWLLGGASQNLLNTSLELAISLVLFVVWFILLDKADLREEKKNYSPNIMQKLIKQHIKDSLESGGGNNPFAGNTEKLDPLLKRDLMFNGVFKSNSKKEKTSPLEIYINNYCKIGELIDKEVEAEKNKRKAFLVMTVPGVFLSADILATDIIQDFKKIAEQDLETVYTGKDGWCVYDTIVFEVIMWIFLSLMVEPGHDCGPNEEEKIRPYHEAISDCLHLAITQLSKWHENEKLFNLQYVSRNLRFKKTIRDHENTFELISTYIKASLKHGKPVADLKEPITIIDIRIDSMISLAIPIFYKHVLLALMNGTKRLYRECVS